MQYWRTAEDASQVPVWKLHGSCNLIQGENPGDPLRFVDPDTAVVWYTEDGRRWPGMCFYEPRKLIMGEFHPVTQLVRSWGALVGEVRQIVVIGVGLRAPDDHIWQPLASTPAHLYYVGGQSDWKTWVKLREDRPSRWLGATFEDALPGVIETLQSSQTPAPG